MVSLLPVRSKCNWSTNRLSTRSTSCWSNLWNPIGLRCNTPLSTKSLIGINGITRSLGRNQPPCTRLHKYVYVSVFTSRLSSAFTSRFTSWFTSRHVYVFFMCTSSSHQNSLHVTSPFTSSILTAPPNANAERWHQRQTWSQKMPTDVWFALTLFLAPDNKTPPERQRQTPRKNAITKRCSKKMRNTATNGTPTPNANAKRQHQHQTPTPNANINRWHQTLTLNPRKLLIGINGMRPTELLVGINVTFTSLPSITRLLLENAVRLWKHLCSRHGSRNVYVPVVDVLHSSLILYALTKHRVSSCLQFSTSTFTSTFTSTSSSRPRRLHVKSL